jgi:hypothetical protein
MKQPPGTGRLSQSAHSLPLFELSLATIETDPLPVVCDDFTVRRDAHGTSGCGRSRNLEDRHFVGDAAQRHAPEGRFSPLLSSRGEACAFSTTCSVATAARPRTREGILTVWIVLCTPILRSPKRAKQDGGEGGIIRLGVGTLH